MLGTYFHIKLLTAAELFTAAVLVCTWNDPQKLYQY